MSRSTAVKPATLPLSKSDGGKAPLKLATQTLMSANNIHKSYRKGTLEVPVLKGVDLEIAEGSFTAIVGQSGSGKSTLLHLLATLDAPDQGEVHFQDRRIDNLPSRQREAIRNQEFGLIFQFYHLLPELSTLENVLVPKMVQDGFFSYLRNKRAYKKRATELIEMVGLGHRMTHRPSEMSGGEMQRTAIARALISEPSIILADEPTGNLDEQNGDEVLDTLNSLRNQENLTVVMVTHDASLAQSADKTIKLVDGRVV